MASALTLAIEKTKKYASFFGLPLTNPNLHLWLISSRRYSFKLISRHNPEKLGEKDLRLIASRKRLSQQKIILAHKVASFLHFIPGIKMIAVTGSVAVENARPKDDLDLMIIVRSNTIWLIRPLITFLLKFSFRLRRPNQSQNYQDTLCLNLWLDTKAMLVPAKKQNLYTAHEVLQILPILDRDQTYQNFLSTNSWTKKFLANAFFIKSKSVELNSSRFSLLDLLLSLPNLLFFIIQYLYMRSKITKETITPHAAYFHPRNLSSHLQTYLEL